MSYEPLAESAKVAHRVERTPPEDVHGILNGCEPSAKGTAEDTSSRVLTELQTLELNVFLCEIRNGCEPSTKGAAKNKSKRKRCSVSYFTCVVVAKNYLNT